MVKLLYERLLDKYGFEKKNENVIPQLIEKYLRIFMKNHNRVAIYGNGQHTQMLMVDYIFQLKNIVAIVENYSKENNDGFKIICDEQIEDEKIDGIIISSYLYKDEIKEKMKKNHPKVDVLDIYYELKKDGVCIKSNYYNVGHPYAIYRRLNDIKLEQKKTKGNIAKLLFDEITIFVEIKDFRLAIEKAKLLYAYSHDSKDKELISDLEKLYAYEIKAFSNISSDNVIMMCLDGLRNKDLSQEKMPKLYEYVIENGYAYSNTYSYSTSTYESLVPVYSENTDFKTNYYECAEVEEKDCRFIKKCIEQNRQLFFYTDFAKYICSNAIKYNGKTQTITERMWDFLLDAQNTTKGLFYLHHLYESHFSFPSPYCSDLVVADGTAMLFDYLEKKGGMLRADYVKQQAEALAYIDDTLTPFLKALHCRMVLFADHGNILLGKDKRLSEINRQYLTCHEDWLRIPFVIISPEYGKGGCDNITSLLELNEVVVSLLDNTRYVPRKKTWIKCGRSRIYNPDFKYLYKLLNEEKRLQAFECFVFKDYKLVVYSDGETELYTKEDEIISDAKKMENFYSMIKKHITVV